MEEFEIDLGSKLYRINGIMFTFYPRRLNKKEELALSLSEILYEIAEGGFSYILIGSKGIISKSQIMSVYDVDSNTAKEYLDFINNEMKKLGDDISYIDNDVLYINLDKFVERIIVILKRLNKKIRKKGFVLITYADKDIIKNILVKLLKSRYSSNYYKIYEDYLPVGRGKFYIMVRRNYKYIN